MPKRIRETDLQSLQDLVLQHPEGIAIGDLEALTQRSTSRRTLFRRLSALVNAGRIQRRGALKGARYFPATTKLAQPAVASAQFDTPEGPVAIPLAPVSRDLLDYVSKPEASRTPIGYQHRFLDEYQPNRTAYLPDRLKVHLHQIGRPIEAERAAGTFARDILGRLLIDLSYSSSRLEGNTYSRLDTQRLIELGQPAPGKDAKETQMILNHKAAIELLVKGGEDIGINRFTLLNLHALLSEDLMADPEASGHLRRRPVEIGRSVYTPPAVPQVVEERFDLLIKKAAAIADPFEQAFFLMAQLLYLQPFEDVNKRVSRLAANISLIRSNLCPLSFLDVPERAYVAGTMAVYELTRVELLRDVFAWAYERSCEKYVAIRDSVAEPNLFRMKHRHVLSDVIAGIVREARPPTEGEVRRRARAIVEEGDREKFVELVIREFGRLYEGNIARYGLGLAEFRAWKGRVSS